MANFEYEYLHENNTNTFKSYIRFTNYPKTDAATAYHK